MQVNSASFAPTYQAAVQQPVRESNPQDLSPEQRNQQVNDTLDKRNDLLQSQEQNQQQKRDAVTDVAGYKNTQNNIDTYTAAYQNATGDSSSSSSSNSLSYSDVQDINQTVNRNQLANSDILQNVVDRQQQEQPTLYTVQGVQGVQAQNNVGSTINAFA